MFGTVTKLYRKLCVTSELFPLAVRCVYTENDYLLPQNLQTVQMFITFVCLFCFFMKKHYTCWKALYQNNGND